MPDIKMAQQFLDALGSAPYVFQTYTDNKEKRKAFSRNAKGKHSDPLGRIFAGSFEQHQATLSALNLEGAGIFVRICAGDKPYKEGVTGIRAIFIDIDNEIVPSDKVLDYVSQHMPTPSIVVKSSPNKYHIYWRITDCPLESFKSIQQQLAIKFGTDQNVKDLNRVMRLPGYNHCKSTPKMAKLLQVTDTIISINDVYSRLADVENLTPTKSHPTTKKINNAFNLEDYSYAKFRMFDELVPGVNRTNRLMSLGGHLLRKNLPLKEIEEELMRVNVELSPDGGSPYAQLELDVLKGIRRLAAERDCAIVPAIQNVKSSIPPPPLTSKKKVPPLPPSQKKLPPLPPSNKKKLDKDFTNSFDEQEVRTLNSWADRFRFIGAGSRVADLRKRGQQAVISLTDFKNLYANVRNKNHTPLYKLWLESRNRKDIQNTTYKPCDEKIIFEDGELRFNTYMPATILPALEINIELLQPFFEYIEQTFEHANEQKLILDWMAFTYQYPEKRIPWAPVLISRQGAGKGFLFSVMREVMGPHNCALVLPKVLEAAYNNYLYETTLICYDEMHRKLRKGCIETLKSTLVERYAQINDKYIKMQMRRIYPNTMILSNDINDVLQIDQDDRRYWVYQWFNKPSASDFERYWNWLKDKNNISHFMAWLKARDISQFNWSAPPPMTEAKKEVYLSQFTPIDLAVKDAIDNKYGPLKADVLSFELLKDYMDTTGLEYNVTELMTTWKRQSTSCVKSPTYKEKRYRVRCVRNEGFWKRKAAPSLAYELKRANQFFRTPDKVDPPILSLVIKE